MHVPIPNTRKFTPFGTYIGAHTCICMYVQNTRMFAPYKHNTCHASVYPPAGSESKLKKKASTRPFWSKNDRKNGTPTVFQAAIVPGTQIRTQDLPEECTKHTQVCPINTYMQAQTRWTSNSSCPIMGRDVRSFSVTTQNTSPRTWNTYNLRQTDNRHMRIQ